MSRKKRKVNKIKYLVDIVIPVHGRFDLLQRCLHQIPDAFEDITYKIILVDDFSNEKDRQFYRMLDKSVRVIKNRENLGFGITCNKGFRHGTSPLVLFLNSDAFLHAGSGVELVKTMDNPDVGIVGMKLLFAETDEQEQSTRPIGKIQHIGMSFNIRAEPRHLYMGWDADHPRPNSVSDVPAVTGAALMVRRTLFQRVGGFGNEYQLGTWEDVDLCMKIAELGKKIQVNPKAVGDHYVGASVIASGKMFPLEMNKQTFYNKWQDKLRWTDGDLL